MTHTLLRPRRGKVIAGVCAAVADRFGLSRTLVRTAFVLFGLFGVGEVVYIVLWILIPKSPLPDVPAGDGGAGHAAVPGTAGLHGEVLPATRRRGRRRP